LHLRHWLATEEEFGALMRSTTHLNWWTHKPIEVAKRLRAKLRRILFEAIKEGKDTRQKYTTARKAKPIKPPLERPKPVFQISAQKRASDQKNTRHRLRKRV
jgi:hypothetical protein